MFDSCINTEIRIQDPDSKIESGIRIQELNLGFGFRNQIQDSDSGTESRIWIQDLSLGFGFWNQIRNPD
jgi:hypothetical protein